MPAKKGKKIAAAKKKVLTANEKAQWKTFRELKAKVDQKLAKLKKDFKKDVPSAVLIEDIGILGLLGGECNYMLSQLEKAEKSGAPRKAAVKKSSAKKRVIKKATFKKTTKKRAAAKK